MSDFWSRRRAAVQQETRAEEAEQEAAVQARTEQALAERSDEELLAEAGLPLPEDIVSGEQVQAFLKAALPQRLKTRALRALWKSNPVLACVDGLNDYDGDFTAAAYEGQEVKTLYKVGRGLVDTFADLKPAVATPEPEVDEAPEAAPEGDEAPQEAVQVAAAPDPAAEAPEADPIPVASRRMRFTFDPLEGAS
ncbi:DUF3306 domain-containing protein [Ponticoccus litoralis]|uniref:DUF3306 domain-containing protein n=1 Tax=Ponticoccus litoralis TaxID=422297 RepID=A0AAW9SQ40_9RHOB